MSAANPVGFKIAVIEHQERFGILIERRERSGATTVAYFYPDQNDGLAPTPEIFALCGPSHHRVATRHYEQALLRELKVYTEAVVANGGEKIRSDIKQVYEARGYSQAISHFFERSRSPLKKMFVSPRVFKEKVLQQVRASKELKGKAQRYQVTPLSQLRRAHNFRYLRPMRNVLRIGDSGLQPQWFRRQGPMEADFLAKCVVMRNDEVKRIWGALQDGKITVVVGDSASGKSSLVRQLMYMFHNEDTYDRDIFYLNCGEYSHLDEGNVLDEIRQVTGLVVVEDAHIFAAEVDRMLDRLRTTARPALLVVMRPSFWDRLDPKSSSNLVLKDDAIQLEVNDVAERIMEAYDPQLSKSDDGTREIRDRLKEATGQNLWLLAYALAGRQQSQGKGIPSEWIACAVVGDLHRLGYQAADSNAIYPQILVSLSVLYRHEIPTAESYLVGRLGFDPNILNRLVARGDITRTCDAQHAYYGLPHSCLANAFWEHGQRYWRPVALRAALLPGNLQEQQDAFLYDYAASGAGNGLRAINVSAWDLRAQLLARLDSEGLIDHVLESSDCPWELCYWAKAVAENVAYSADVMPASRWQSMLKSEQLDQLFGSALTSPERVPNFGAWFLSASSIPFRKDAWQHIWQGVDHVEFAQRIQNHPEGIGCLEKVLCGLACGDKAAAIKFLKLLDYQELAKRAVREESLRDVHSFLTYLRWTDEHSAKKFLKQADTAALGRRLDASCNMRTVAKTLETVTCIDPKIGAHLWSLLDHKQVAERLMSMNEPVLVCSFLSILGRNMASDIWQLLDHQQLADDTMNAKEPVTAAFCFRLLHRTSREMAHRFYSLLKKQSLASWLVDTASLSDIEVFLGTMHEMDLRTAEEFLTAIPIPAIAERMAGLSEESTNCLCAACGINVGVAEEVSRLLGGDEFPVKEAMDYCPVRKLTGRQVSSDTCLEQAHRRRNMMNEYELRLVGLRWSAREKCCMKTD